MSFDSNIKNLLSSMESIGEAGEAEAQWYRDRAKSEQGKVDAEVKRAQASFYSPMQQLEHIGFKLAEMDYNDVPESDPERAAYTRMFNKLSDWIPKIRKIGATYSKTSSTELRDTGTKTDKLDFFSSFIETLVEGGKDFSEKPGWFIGTNPTNIKDQREMALHVFDTPKLRSAWMDKIKKTYGFVDKKTVARQLLGIEHDLRGKDPDKWDSAISKLRRFDYTGIETKRGMKRPEYREVYEQAVRNKSKVDKKRVQNAQLKFIERVTELYPIPESELRKQLLRKKANPDGSVNVKYKAVTIPVPADAVRLFRGNK